MDAQTLGRAGENAAAEHYRHVGYDVLDTNWTCPSGELDLVVARGAVVVFCEVKTRRSAGYGGPAAAVTVDKQRRIRRLAARWLTEHPSARRREIRFDVAAVHPVGGAFTVDVLIGAF